tara:strand:- start:294 stop:569 length:276 start_codon:yes stop_codon:yes gene_type:complete
MDTEASELSLLSSIFADEMPCYILSGSGYDWFFSPDAGQMVRIARGVEIIPLDEVDESPEECDNSSEKMLVSSPSYTFLIPKNELVEVGYN